MLRKMLFIVLIAATSQAFAQTSGSAEIDYKQVGAPLPRMKLAAVLDTVKPGQALQPGQPPIHGHGLARVETPAPGTPMNQFTTDEDLDNGANLFVMIFNPTCSHCQEQTQIIEKNIGLFHKSQFVFLANPVMRPYVPDFIKQFHIGDYKNFHIGIDSSDFLQKAFLYRSLPQINVYSEDRKLLKIFTGDVVIDSLKEYIE